MRCDPADLARGQRSWEPIGAWQKDAFGGGEPTGTELNGLDFVVAGDHPEAAMLVGPTDRVLQQRFVKRAKG